MQREHLTSIAVIGPNARVAQIMGGGSAQVNAHYAITPFEGIVAQVGDHVSVRYEEGCTNFRLLPLLDVGQLLAATQGNEHGMAVEYFNSSDLAGTPVYKETKATSELIWFEDFPQGVNREKFSLRATARFTPQESGSYTFGLVSTGRSRLSIDGREVIDNWTQQTRSAEYFGMGSTEVQAVVTLEAGHQYLLTLEFARAEAVPLAAVRLGCLPPVRADELERAAALAASSDVAIVCVGFGGDWQSEGFDRPDMELPGKQNTLVERVAAANPRTIVLRNTGSPITMPWLDKVAAVLQAWYPGQECGNGIADVLFGDTNPSGKLPQTFPVRLEDNPAYLNFPGENGKVYYGEGLFIGYRYYDKKQIAPLFPFGFGLSYTTFDYDTLRLSARQIGQTKERQTLGTSSTTNTDMHHSHTWSSTCWQYLRYGLVGGANTLMDLLMLNVLLWGFPTNNVLVLVVYNSVAYSCGAVSSFFLNKYWTFRRKQRTTLREVVRFAIILALEILYSNGLVWLAGKALQPLIANPTLWGDASKLVAVAIGAVLSYAFMRFWIFAGRSQDRPKQQKTHQ